MSLLLDALNKADKERKKNQDVPSIDSQHQVVINQNSAGKNLIIAVCILVILLIGAIIYWTQFSKKSAATTKAVSSAQTLDHTKTAEPSALDNKATINSATDLNKPLEKETETKGEGRQKVADLYQQNSTTVYNNEQNLANTSTSTKLTNTQTAETTPASIDQLSNLPDLHDLPDSVLSRIPSMKYTEHHFNKLSNTAQGGSIMINGNLKHVNEQIVAGVYLDKILEDGVVLRFENYTFKMRALNSWVNM